MKTLAAAFAAGALVAAMAQGWRYGEQLAVQQSAHDKVMTEQAGKAREAADAALAKQITLQAEAEAADKKHTEVLTSEQAENKRLRNLYESANADNRRLRIRAKCPTVPDPASPGSVGDDGTVELSGEAGRAVWDLREALIADRAKLRYLQEYARSCHGG
jgi:prophage endopeptidase